MTTGVLMPVNRPKFCFVIHPLSLEDVARYEPGAKGKGDADHPQDHGVDAAVGGRARDRRPRRPTGAKPKAGSLPRALLPEQMVDFPREEVYKRILRAIEIGVELGAEVAGLGAFTGVVGDGGITINGAFADSGDDRQLAHDRRRRTELLSRRARDGHRRGSVDGRRRRCDGIDRRGVRDDRSRPRSSTSFWSRATRRGCASSTNQIADELPCESSYTTDISDAVRRAQLVLTATSLDARRHPARRFADRRGGLRALASRTTSAAASRRSVPTCS